MANKTRKRAYRVYEKHEDREDGMWIVMAPTAAQARSAVWYGAFDIVADDYIDLRARREPWADVYVDTEHIPLQAFLEHGWEWACCDCDRDVTIADIGGVTEAGWPLCGPCAQRRGVTQPAWAQREEA